MDYNNAYSQAVEEYCLRTKRSQEAYQKAKQVMPGGDTRTTSYYKPYTISVEKAAGSKLIDLDGNEYLDFLCNYTSIIHGYVHPLIEKRVQAAMALGTAVPASIPEQAQLAQIICERVPSIELVRFCNSGTEATMFAIRAARAFKGRDGIIKMEGGYHGSTDLVEFSVKPSITPGLKRSQIEPTPDSAGVPMNVGRDIFIAPFNDLGAIEAILKNKAKEIAAIIVEPMMGAAGIIPAQPGYLAGLRRLADEYDVLLIFDEVQSFRLAVGGAQERYNVIPDITALGKIIGGGFPVGAFGGRAEIMEPFDPSNPKKIGHGGTFNGNRITMAAGVASMELLDKEAINHLEKLAQRLENQLKSAIALYSIPASITRAGSLLNLHFTTEPPLNYAATHSPNKKLLPLYHLEMLNRGIFSAPRGAFVLSTVMTEEEIDTAAKAFRDVMQKIAQFV